MPNITHENLDALNAVVTIELSQNDYLPKVNKKLKEYRQKAQIKGFRPGKVPMGMIKRKFGNALLVEEVNEVVGEKMNNYFNENKIKVLGQPLAIEDNKVVLSINKPSDYTFKFELGIAPEFELKGLSTESKLPFYDIEVLQEELEKEIDNVRRKFSNGFMEGITDIQEEDMLSISLHELDEKSEMKKEGVIKEETFLALKDVVNPELRENLLSATINDTFDINIFNIEDKTEEHIRKHILGIEADKEINETFRLTIKEIKRVAKAELNEDFFNKVFPEQGVSTVDTFNEKVKEEIYKNYKQSALNHYTNLAFDFLLEENQLDLPEEFLTKWLKSSQDNLSKEFFDGEEFQNFLKNLRWSLIREKIAEQFKVEVQYKDVEDMTRNEILRYFNYQIPAFGEMMDGMLEKVLSDKNEVNRRFEMLMDQKVLENAAENMGKDMIPVNKEQFEKIVKEHQDSKNKLHSEKEKEKEDNVIAE